MSASPPERVVIAGGGLAGVRTAESLRSAGFAGSITIIADEPGLPYDRPPLSKQVLRHDLDIGEITLTTRAALEAIDIDLRAGCEVLGVNGDAVQTTMGQVAYDNLVVATGSRARTLPGLPPDGHEAIHHLRTADDSRRLRRRLGAGRTLLTVGGGFIGAEVASAALAAEGAVTMVEAAEAPCLRAVGPAFASALAELYRDRGVTLLAGTSVTEIVSTDSGRLLVELANAMRLQVDDVLVGIGTVPCSGWLPGHDHTGVRCDDQGRALDVPGELFGRVYAVGDVSRWPNPWGEQLCVEHWTTAVDHARTVAAALMNLEHPLPRPPYFWSDQFGVRLQLTGWPHRSTATKPWTDARGHHVTLYLDDADRVVGVLTVNAPAVLARARQRLVAFPLLRDFISEFGLTEVATVDLRACSA